MKKIIFLLLLICGSVSAQNFKLENPVTATWIKQNLKKSKPKIILTKELLTQIKETVPGNDAVKAYYHYLYKNAESLIVLPVLERKMEGKRLLAISREAVRRIGALSIVYAISGEKRFLDRANDEITAVCNFSDWNPNHFLDVAEAAYAIAIGLDWTLGDLPAGTKELAKKSLIKKAIEPSFNEPKHAWISAHNNWNQVCHGGLSVAAVAIADEHPELAAKVISRALEYMPPALNAYAPDGAYPEGASYWAYGTSYTLITISVFKSAFGTDFGISNAPGFVKSAEFVKKLAGPSGLYFNYFDSGEKGNDDLENQELLSWFTQKTGNGVYFDKNKLIEKLKTASTNGTNISKMNGSALTWIVACKPTNKKPLPINWKGDGKNPVAIFGPDDYDSAQFYLGAKGGSAGLSHGNMDAGSFVFELNGVRWSVDPGNQDYNELEAIMGNGLWDNKQTGKRWTLLTKNNFGHSTLTVNNELHNVNGFAPVTKFTGNTDKPEVEIDLSEVLKAGLTTAKRRFIKLSPQKLLIEDAIETSENTQEIIWAMMTEADIELVKGGALLRQHNKTLKVLIHSPAEIQAEVIQLDPPPLAYDKKILGLKRLQFRLSSAATKEKKYTIVVELNGEKM